MNKHTIIYFLRIVLIYTMCFASAMMGAWIERHYGDSKTEPQTLSVSEWAGIVCGPLDTHPLVSLCPADIGGVNICHRDCQLVPYRHVEL